MDTLDIVIIVCVIIGALALCFVFYILYWAWQYDKRNRDQFRADNAGKDKKSSPTAEGAVVKTGNDDDVSSYGAPAGTAEEKKSGNNNNATSDNEKIYPSEIGLDDSLYPESVISEDVNSSVRNSDSMGGGAGYLPNSPASVSSMDVESYGYSIEAHSLATGTNTDIGSATKVKSQESLLDSQGEPPESEEPVASYY